MSFLENEYTRKYVLATQAKILEHNLASRVAGVLDQSRFLRASYLG
jgi:hypothetical protein